MHHTQYVLCMYIEITIIIRKPTCIEKPPLTNEKGLQYSQQHLRSEKRACDRPVGSILSCTGTDTNQESIVSSLLTQSKPAQLGKPEFGKLTVTSNSIYKTHRDLQILGRTSTAGCCNGPLHL